MYENDVWSGLADFLANMIEKYAGEMDLDALPDPREICRGDGSGRTAGSQTAKQAERHRRSVSKIYAAQCRSETGCITIRPILWIFPWSRPSFLLKNGHIYGKMHVESMSKLLRSR